jgi:hypothetical protein
MAKATGGSAGTQDGVRPIPRGRLAAWLVPCCFLAAALVLTWRLWADPASRAQTIAANGISHDVDLFAWFVRYDATAVAHGHLPLVTKPPKPMVRGLIPGVEGAFDLPVGDVVIAADAVGADS